MENDENLIEYIFSSGFSLSEEVTSDSGRGIGMDEVKHRVDEIGGKITIDTDLGSETTFSITIPYVIIGEIMATVLIIDKQSDQIAEQFKLVKGIFTFSVKNLNDAVTF